MKLTGPIEGKLGYNLATYASCTTRGPIIGIICIQRSPMTSSSKQTTACQPDDSDKRLTEVFVTARSMSIDVDDESQQNNGIAYDVGWSMREPRIVSSI